MVLTRDEIEEIEKKVMEKYPKLERERTCATEKRLRNLARQSYREKLTKQLMEEKVNL